MHFSLSGVYLGCQVVHRQEGDKYYFAVSQGLDVCKMSCTKDVYDLASKIKPYTPVSADVQIRVFEGKVYYASGNVAVSQ